MRIPRQARPTLWKTFLVAIMVALVIAPGSLANSVRGAKGALTEQPQLLLALLRASGFPSRSVTIDDSCALNPGPVVPPPTDTVWIEDAWSHGSPETYDQVTWLTDTTQRASGTASFPAGPPDLMGVRELVAVFQQQPPIIHSGDRFVAYVLIDPCDPPPAGIGVEIAADVVVDGFPLAQLLRYYWGEQTLWMDAGFDPEADPVRLGDVPASGQWVRLEIPANLPVPEGAVWNLRLLVSDWSHHAPSNIWWDHIGIGAASPSLTVTDVVPNIGAAAGGTAVRIVGSGFTAGPTTVRFGDSEATNVEFVSSEELAAITPAGTGTVDVQVVTTTASATLADAFTYFPPPTFTSLQPGKGSVAGGQTITIRGQNFLASTTVSFGGVPASGVHVQSENELTAVTPAHAAGSVDVTLATPFGSVTTAQAFTYLAQPLVTTFSPAEALAGTAVVISGQHFDPESAGNQVFFGTAPAAVAAATATEIIATVPSTATSGPITVTTAGGTGVSSGSFVVLTYTGLAIDPPSATAAVGSTVTFRARALLSNGATQDVSDRSTWSSSNTSVATVNQTGVATAVAAGSCSVTAQFLGFTGTASLTVPEVVTLPPDPASVAPPVPTTHAADFASAVSFLYTGENPIQRGVTPGALALHRLAVVRGRAISASGEPLPGVRVEAHGDAPAGYTLTREDGQFDLVINGGGPVVLTFERDGYISAHRRLLTPWHDFVTLADTTLVPYDSHATSIDLTQLTTTAVAEGTPTTDARGTRHATVLFSGGTAASMRLSDGSVQSLPRITVRATEQSATPSMMPAELPPETGFTYCVELSADEAVAAAATKVEFTKPVVLHVENFLGFPVGGAVPVGYYDREKAEWIASDNGRIIKILSVSNGVAALDVNGDGMADTSAATSLGITDDERRILAAKFPVGQSLWRVSITHFTPFDLNWTVGLPAGAEDPSLPPPWEYNDLLDPACHSGSIIECESLTLGQSIPIAGTPFTLEYRSRNVPGYDVDGEVEITLSKATVPAPLKRIDFRLSFAGKRQEASFLPLPNQKTIFKWNGADPYGRAWPGDLTLNVEIGYAYDGEYRLPPNISRSFAAMAGQDLTGIKIEQVRWQTFQIRLRGPRPDQGLGGWTISPVHSYDPKARLLRLGSGTDVPFEALGSDFVSVLQEQSVSSVMGVATGADGTLYPFFSGSIFRITPEGASELFAGIGFRDARDGVRADEARLNVQDVTVHPSGDVVLAHEDFSSGTFRVFRIQQGVLRQLVQSTLNIRSIAAGPNGAIYFIERPLSTGGDLRRVDATGNVSTVAVKTSEVNYETVFRGGDGNVYVRVNRRTSDPFNPTVTSLQRVFFGGSWVNVTGGSGACRAAVDQQGRMYVDLCSGAPRIRVVEPDGKAHDFISATAVQNVLGLTAEGRLITRTSDRRVCPEAAQPGVSCVVISDVASGAKSSSGYTAASPSSGEVFKFRASGAHYETRDSLTNVLLAQIQYDDDERPTEIIDTDGLVTRIERGSGGVPLAIVAPNGDRTSLQLDANGWLRTVDGPEGRHEFTYTTSGLLRTHRNPRGFTSTYDYDQKGRLELAADAAGGSKQLTFSTTGGLDTIRLLTAEAANWAYTVERRGESDLFRTTTDPRGLTASTSRSAAATMLQLPDGSQATLTRVPDPRGGAMAPYISKATITLPSGRTLTAVRDRSTTFAPGDPLSVTTFSERITIGGRTWTSTYSGATRSIRSVSPLGRAVEHFLDTHGRIREVRAAGVAPLSVEYDQRGGLAAVSIGTRRGTFTWNEEDQLVAATDSQGRAITFTYDAAGRLASEVFPDQRSIGYTYDSNGNLTSITPPDRQAYLFGYSPVDLQTEFTAPGAATRYIYDRDRRLTQIVRPDQSTIGLGYTNSRIISITTAERSLVPAYDAEGRVRVLYDTRGPDLEYTWDGYVPTSEAWTGEVSGRVSWGIDDHFRLSTETVNGSTVSFGYDGDSLLTAAGALTIGRDQGNGRLVSTTVGAIGEAFVNDTFGEIDRYAASNNGTEFFVIHYERDSLGRIVERRETRFGITSVESYGSDTAGRLETVHRDGTLAATYAYDANGNRTSMTADGIITAGSYDAQDRLLTYGNSAYTWTANGELLSKSDAEGTTTYSYDAFGNLRTVGLSDGRFIEYIIDAEDRRVGKKVDGVIVSRWLYSGNRLIAELDAEGAVRSRFVYGSRITVPDYMTIGSATYRIIADHLGSVRYVVDAANGMVMQSARYDEWGNVLFDSNPGFQPFGFAGGLADRDTGFVRFGARDYDPHTGRWTAKDPILFRGGDTNLYGYGFNDPVNFVDPDGKNPLAGALAAGGVAALADGPLPIGEIVAIGIIGYALWHNHVNTPAVPAVPTITESRGRSTAPGRDRPRPFEDYTEPLPSSCDFPLVERPPYRGPERPEDDCDMLFDAAKRVPAGSAQQRFLLAAWVLCKLRS